MQQFVRNVCAKFKVDCLSCFRTGARYVLTTQKRFPSEIVLTMKTATSNSLSTHFLIKLSSVKFILEIFDVKQIYFRAKYSYSIRVFPFLISFSCWNETNTSSSIKEDRRKMENCNIKPITLQRNFLEVTGNRVTYYYARSIYIKVFLEIVVA